MLLNGGFAQYHCFKSSENQRFHEYSQRSASLLDIFRNGRRRFSEEDPRKKNKKNLP